MSDGSVGPLQPVIIPLGVSHVNGFFSFYGIGPPPFRSVLTTLSLLFSKVIDAVFSKVLIFTTIILSIAILVFTSNISISSFSSY